MPLCSFADITIFVLSLLVGFEVISKVPATLHTPLMSGSNAIHGVVVVGVMMLAATVNTPVGYVLLIVAAVVRGDERRRRLRRHRPNAGDVPHHVRLPTRARRPQQTRRYVMSAFDTLTHILYLLAAAGFVLGLHLMNSPATARRGNLLSAAGMVVAVATTIASSPTTTSITAHRSHLLTVGLLGGGRPDCSPPDG